MVWVNDHTGSLFVTMLMHISLVLSTVIVDPVLEGRDLVTYLVLRAAILWIIAIRIVMVRRRAV